MGKYLLDQFTLLHFSVGVIVYFWGISLPSWILLHTLFEILENTKIGRNVINKYIKFWPGGKPKADSFINNIGDTIGGVIGWLVSYYLDREGNKRGWYD